MPSYLYRCPEGHEFTVIHGMLEITRQFCPLCGAEAHRKPQALAIKRSCFIEPSPAIKQHLDNVPRLRDEYERKHHG
jgi:putative FmdB family regulatory protein